MFDLRPEQSCSDCLRYEANPKPNHNHPLGLYAVGYCKVPVATSGLLGTCQEGESLNILFARGLYNCNKGRKWFLPEEEEK